MHDASVVQGARGRTEDGVGLAHVGVERDGGDVGGVLYDALDELALAGQALAIGDDGQQQLVSLPTGAHYGMAQQAAALVLVVGGYLAQLRRLGKRVQHAAAALVFD